MLATAAYVITHPILGLSPKTTESKPAGLGYAGATAKLAGKLVSGMSLGKPIAWIIRANNLADSICYGKITYNFFCHHKNIFIA